MYKLKQMCYNRKNIRQRQVFLLAVGFPLYVDLKDNNCTVFGGGEDAYEAALILRRFDAKVTVVSPTVCEALQKMDKAGEIRYLRRKYFRGDCSSARLCVALTDDPATNIAISDECKNKNIPVALNNPQGFGNFSFPRAAICGDTVVTVSGSAGNAQQRFIAEKLEELLPQLINEYKQKM